MGVDIYAMKPSPPCRAAFLVAKAIGLDYKIKILQLHKSEHMAPEFLKMNPAHTVPVMIDGNVTVADSKAIITYFMNKYAPDSNLYPKDPAARALVDQRLYFDSQLFASYRGVVFPVAFAFVKSLKQSQANMLKLEENMNLLETFLTRSAYVAGEELSIADLATLANVSSMEAMGLDLPRWPQINSWLSKLKTELPYYEEANAEGAQMLGVMYKTSLKELEGKQRGL